MNNNSNHVEIDKKEITKKYKILRLVNFKKNLNMKTPCNHIFHTSCLIKWLEIKLECPNCRSNLPSIF